MIKSLSIKNYALIDELEIDFSKGFSIITGETGAGKSILMGALSLITGQRADIGVLKNSEKKCVVEGNFLLAGYGLEDFFDENDLDYANESILRREISPAGKSRAFINDTPVTLNVLKELSLKLIDIHSQHQNLNLNQSEFQLKVVDAYAGNFTLREEYRSVFYQYKELKKQLEKLGNEAAKSKDDLDYLSFRFDELEQAKLIDGEQEELEEEAKTLNNTEEIQRNLAIIHTLLNDDEFSVLVKMKEAHQAANRVKDYFLKITELEERLNSSYIELKDIAEEVETMLSDVEYNPERIEYVNSRLDLIYSLQKKHNVSTIAELLEIKEQLDEQLQNIVSFDDRLERLTTELQNTENKLQQLADKLSAKREKVFSEIEKYVAEQLKHLGMPDATFKISNEKQTEFFATGIDKIIFLFSANANISVQNISKVASGGEISRLMLSIKSLLSQSIGLPTIIFDEIDTGVSGEIADRMASIMKNMSQNMQVISITHLPQVAAKGDTHYLVYKEKKGDTDTSNIRKIEGDERVQELAKMLSGENITREAVENAKVLLEK